MAVQKPSHVSSKIWASQGTVEVPEDAKINSGWTLEVPKFQVENWVQNRSDQFAAHVNERGIAEWDATTDYLAGKSYVQGSDGKIYLAKVNSGPSSSALNPVTDTLKTKWDEAFGSKGSVVFKTGENGAAILPVGSTAQRPTPSEGLLRLNSDTGQMEGYQAGRWGDINITSKELFSGDNLTTEFQLSSSPESKDLLQVYISGVYQQKNTYELGGPSGDLLIFEEAPPTGTDNIEVVVSSLVPSDDRLRQDLADPEKGAAMVGFRLSALNAVTCSLREVASWSVDVRMFGAVGDGVVDDTLALQAAFDFCKAFTVRLRASGKFRVTDTLTFSTGGKRPGLDLDCDQGTELIADFTGDISFGDAGQPAIYLFGAEVLGDYQTKGMIRNLRITKTPSASRIAGIVSTGAWYYDLDGVSIENLDGYGIYLPNRSDLHANPDYWASVSWTLRNVRIVECLDGFHSQAGQGSANWLFDKCYVINCWRHNLLIDGSSVRIIGGAAAYAGRSGVGSGIKIERHLGVTPMNIQIESVEIDGNLDAGIEFDSTQNLVVERCRFISRSDFFGLNTQLSHVKGTTLLAGGKFERNFHRVDNMLGTPTVTLYDFGASNPNMFSNEIVGYRIQNDFSVDVVEASAGAMAAAYGNTVYRAGPAGSAGGARNSDFRSFVFRASTATGGAYPSTPTLVNFNVAPAPTGWQSSGSGGVVTIPYAGMYKVSGALTVDGIAVGARFTVNVFRNGVAESQHYFDASAVSRHTLLFGAAIMANAGDTIEIRAGAGGAGSNTVFGTNYLLIEAL